MMWLLPVILVGGVIWPYLGFLVLGMMVFFLVLSYFKGRYWCGNLCPRGTFLDKYLRRFARDRHVPRLFKNSTFRWSVFILLMAFMVFRLSIASSAAAVGLVFVTMCLLTTVIAIPLGLVFRARSWCAVCPMGTLQGTLSKRKHAVELNSECAGCGVCKIKCPISSDPSSGKVHSRDCIKCGKCSTVCFKDAIQHN